MDVGVQLAPGHCSFAYIRDRDGQRGRWCTWRDSAPHTTYGLRVAATIRTDLPARKTRPTVTAARCGNTDDLKIARRA